MASPDYTYSELQRVSIPEPLGVKEYPEWRVPHPRYSDGTAIQVNAYFDADGHVLERWIFSETKVAWYRIERDVNKRIMVKVANRQPVKI